MGLAWVCSTSYNYNNIWSQLISIEKSTSIYSMDFDPQEFIWPSPYLLWRTVTPSIFFQSITSPSLSFFLANPWPSIFSQFSNSCKSRFGTMFVYKGFAFHKITDNLSLRIVNHHWFWANKSSLLRILRSKPPHGVCKIHKAKEA